MDPLWLLFIGMLVVVGGILVLRLHAFLALILGALVVGALTPAASVLQYALQSGMSQDAAHALAQQSLGARVANGFGSTCAKIGILIAMASIIGKSLMNSGAADRIVRTALKVLGESRAPLAFLSSGFLLATPVYFDTVFYLMIPLGRTMGWRTGRNYTLIVMTIIAGATMAHSLVPPTPGPLFVASALKVSIGSMMLGGLGLGLFTVSAGYLYSLWANRKWPIPIRETVDISLEELKSQAEKKEDELPSFWLSSLPILLPVVLIAGNTIAGVTIGKLPADTLNTFQKIVLGTFSRLGNANIALTIAAAIALGLLSWQKRTNRDELTQAVGTALASAGVIILITASGGAFGGMLQQTGIGHRIQELAATYKLSILPLAFLVTALVRTAQGSATVAMITAVGILGGMADPAMLGFSPLYLALTIGCGSKPFPWMNDSGFWIINRMSGMTVGETLKTSSVMMTLMGITGIIILTILARIMPLI